MSVDKLVVAISSRALFDLRESHAVFESKGAKAYAQYQIERENETLGKGVAFPLVEKLLAINDGQAQPLVEVILVSRNTVDTGLRIFNSIQDYGLDIKRAGFSGGESPYRYIRAFQAHLFLSTNANDVRKALAAHCAAATLLPHQLSQIRAGQLRVAFDGDAVLFSDEAERVYQEKGLMAFSQCEKNKANIPLLGGPFKGFLTVLHYLQQQFGVVSCPIRTALITSRCAPSHERVIRTLRYWGIRIDEAFFLGGLEKTDFLKAFHPDIFFDDQKSHCDMASRYVPTGHVPQGEP